MKEWLCDLLGHRRSRRRARRIAGTWRSECSRCGERLVRDSSGEWRPRAVPARDLQPLTSEPADEPAG